MKNEMIAADIRNWLMDMATGAKAMTKHMKCADVESGDEWKVTSYPYHDVIVDSVITVLLHDIESVADGAGLQLYHRDFVEGDNYFNAFSGEDFVMFNGVKFSDLILRKEKNERK